LPPIVALLSTVTALLLTDPLTMSLPSSTVVAPL